MSIGYNEYINREINLMTNYTEKLIQNPLIGAEFRSDIIFRMMLLETIKSLKTKIYFMQNQERSISEQEKMILEQDIIENDNTYAKCVAHMIKKKLV